MSIAENGAYRTRLYFDRGLRTIKLKKLPAFIEPKDTILRTYYNRRIYDGQSGNDLCFQALTTNKPCMIARIGTTEMGILQAYMDKEVGLIKNIGERRGALLCRDSGFFPNTESALQRFGDLYASSAKYIDLFGTFCTHSEDLFLKKYAGEITLMQVSALGPYYFQKPWSSALAGKKVLVIHPFESTIRRQYTEKREKLFDDPLVLPHFELLTLRAVQTLADNTGGFSDWFAALDYMKTQMQQIDFDIAIIGCGAYGFPLAAYAKELGKQSVLMAGATQLLFGIKGSRWDNAPLTSKYYRDSWVRPDETERPQGADKVEQGCYW